MSDGLYVARSVEMAIARGLVAPSDIHKHGIQGRNLSASNPVALVELGDGTGFLVKGLDSCRDAKQGSTLVELDLYEAAGGRDDLEQYMPTLVVVDKEEGVMVLEGLTNARRLDHRTVGDGPLGLVEAGAFGHALGSWHRSAADMSAPPSLPWILELDREDRLTLLDEDPKLSEIAEEIVSDVELMAELASLRSEWTEDTVIHGDMRFANVLVGPSPDRVRFVDWEFAGRGDSRWDVAGAVQEFLSLAGTHTSARRRAMAAVSEFLDGYGRARTAPAWSDLRPFVVWRLLLRTFQLVNWEGETAVAVADHLSLARSLANGQPMELTPA